MKRKWIIRIMAVLVLLVAGFGLCTYYNAGEFKTLEYQSRYDCRFVGGMPGSEDIVIDLATGTAFISAADFQFYFTGGPTKQGAIFAYSLTGDDPRPVNLTEGFEKPFCPHGIGLFTAPDGTVSLFAVNHQQERQSVEIFDWEEGRLLHRRTVTGDRLHSPNDVAPVGPDRFYVTNDHGARTKAGRILEDYLQIPWSDLLYFDGKTFQTVAEGLKYANGVNLSPDGKYVYVGETLGRGIAVFERNPESGALAFVARHDLGTGVDNINVDESGALWIGAHPKLLTFVRYSKDPENRDSPSQVIRAEIVGGTGLVAVTEYLSPGRTLSGSSAAAHDNDRLLIGSVYDDGFLDCRPALSN